MCTRFLRFTLVAPVLLFLVIFTTGTAGAMSVSHLKFNLKGVRVERHLYTPKPLTVAQLHISNSGTHYLYVDDGTCPDSIDAFKVSSTLTYIGNYPTGGCLQFGDVYGASAIVVAKPNSAHGPCLIYGAALSNDKGFIASFPIDSDGSLGTEISRIYTKSGYQPGNVVATQDGKFAYEATPGADIESYSIGTGCSLTYDQSMSLVYGYYVGMALIGNDLVSPNSNSNNISTYTLGPDGSMSLLSSQNGQFASPWGITFQTYQKLHKMHYRVFTGQDYRGAPHVQGGNFAPKTGAITFLQGSPATDPKGQEGSAVFFDNAHGFLIQGEQNSGTLANYRVNASGMAFVSEVPLAIPNEYPAFFVKLGTTLFVDPQLNGDLEACTLTAQGANACKTVARLRYSYGYSSGLALY